ncbi:hypothetical protein L596_018513 [Steinernema carpocapsae]|uniref:Secreted protein n=1 Tax=Steinernema carpocapsae TaxID=34508 RepID=A0A4U5N4U2_STECR|nr:hypothetical protein L596_018513 [Steinernema carpocapsae]
MMLQIALAAVRIVCAMEAEVFAASSNVCARSSKRPSAVLKSTWELHFVMVTSEIFRDFRDSSLFSRH